MSKKILSITALVLAFANLHSQTNPVISGWMQNTTSIMGSHYVSGNPTPIADAVLANVQQVEYSTNWA